MRKSTAMLWFLVCVIALEACSPTPIPVLPTRDRTRVPTWTLSFEMPSVTVTPGALPATSVEPTGSDNTQAAPPPSATALSTGSSVTPTPSPTARPGIDPTLGAATVDPLATPDLPIPDPVAQLRLNKNIVNILLIGRDTDRTDRAYRTDVLIVVSINKTANSVTLLTIPRDLFVYIPGWTMNRINTAANHGDAIGYHGGGVALLEQTILYNLGIPIHGWARADFQGFKDIVDTLGGVDVPVTCAMQDWRLKDPALDQQNADNWQLFTLDTGVQHMDGDLALWYARSRKRSSDYDRSRRQHQVLRAIFDKALSLQMIGRVPQLYSQYVKTVDTDLGLGDLLQFVPTAANLDKARIKSRFIGRDQVTPWITPQGADVLLPNRDAISSLLAEAFLPPPDNVLARSAPAVEVWNGTTHVDWAALAAADLAWDGIPPVIGQADGSNYAKTSLYDFSTSAKASQLGELQRLFHVKAENVVSAPNPQAAYPYRLVLGADFNPCTQPAGSIVVATPTPGPGSLPGDSTVHAAAVLTPPPSIDGDLSEWAFLPYPASVPISGQSNWQGPADLSATWNAAWDAQNLYLALDVNDSTFVQVSRGANLDQGNSVEVWLSAQPVAGSGRHSLNDGDFRLGLSPGNLVGPVGGPEAYLWLPASQARSLQEVRVAARLTNSGYALEAAIPWKVFNVAPGAGQSFGLALALNDDDTPGVAGQQLQVTNRKGQQLADPNTWGILVLDNP